MRLRRSAAVLLCIAVVVSGCSRFERRDRADQAIGEDVIPIQNDNPIDTEVPVQTDVPVATTGPAQPTTAPLTPPPTGDGGPRSPVTERTEVDSGVANRSVVDHPGWRVSLTVGEKAEYAVSDTVPIEIALQNTSDHLRHHEVDQPDSVVITRADDPARRVWSHLECNPTLSVYEQPGGLRGIESGESASSIVRYPVSEECRLPPGDYVVFGQWSVCPDDARRETANPGTFACAEGRAEFVDAGPVPLRLR